MWAVCGREASMQGTGGKRDHIQGGRITLKWSLQDKDAIV